MCLVSTYPLVPCEEVSEVNPVLPVETVSLLCIVIVKFIAAIHIEIQLEV